MFSPFYYSKLIRVTILRIQVALRFKIDPKITISLAMLMTTHERTLAMTNVYTNCATPFSERLLKSLLAQQVSTISCRYANRHSTYECRQTILPSRVSTLVKQVLSQNRSWVSFRSQIIPNVELQTFTSLYSPAFDTISRLFE